MLIERGVGMSYQSIFPLASMDMTFQEVFLSGVEVGDARGFVGYAK